MQVPPFWHGLDWQSSTSGGKERVGEPGTGTHIHKHVLSKRLLFKPPGAGCRRSNPREIRTLGEIKSVFEKIVIKAT